MLYRQKPLVIDAIQWHPPENTKHQQIPEVSVEYPEVLSGDGSFWPAYAIVRTPKGDILFLYAGDWLLKDCTGALSVVHADAFSLLYEPAA